MEKTRITRIFGAGESQERFPSNLKFGLFPEPEEWNSQSDRTVEKT